MDEVQIWKKVQESDKRGCAGHGNLRDVDMRVELWPLLRAQIDFPDSSTPGQFLSKLIHRGGPYVVLPDGKIIGRHPEREYSSQFNDGVAKAFATQSGGLFFPEAEGGEVTSFRFSIQDFIQAVKWLAVNETQRFKDMYKNPEAFKALELDAGYVDPEVYPLTAKDIFSEERAASGLVGKLDVPKVSPGLKADFQISLGIGLNGFGYYHTGISHRILSSDFFAYGIKKNSLEGEALSRFVNGINHNWGYAKDVSHQANADLGLDFTETAGQVRLTIKSPGRLFSDGNSQLKKSAMGVTEMASLYLPIASKVYGAIKRAEDLQQRRQRDKADQVLKDLDLEVQLYE